MARCTPIPDLALCRPADYSYGDRQYGAEDLAGHRWDFSEIADVTPEEWGGTPADLVDEPDGTSADLA